MAFLGEPDYGRLTIISAGDRVGMEKYLGNVLIKGEGEGVRFVGGGAFHPCVLQTILTSFVIYKVTFQFPPDTKYPSIPVYIDKTTTVYPLEGTALLTGVEYILAHRQGCDLKVAYAVVIPFKGGGGGGGARKSDPV